MSNITQLTDDLTRLGPVDRLLGFADFLAKEKNQDLGKLLGLIADIGGTSRAIPVLDRYRQQFDGSGRPPCLFEMLDGRRVRRFVAAALVTDSTITFTRETAALHTLLAELKLSYSEVESLSHAGFRRVFGALVEMHPGCRFDMRLVEETDRVFGRDAVGSAFRYQIDKRGSSARQ